MKIQEIKVTNFRSLKNTHIGDLGNMVVFYGENDTGKSNILSFLDILFRTKVVTEQTISASANLIEEKPSGFWRGDLLDFSDNFFRNEDSPITFSISVKFESTEISNDIGISKTFLDQLTPTGDGFVLVFDGIIEKTVSSKAKMSLTAAKFDNKIFYDEKNVETDRFLSSFKGLSVAEKRDIFEKIMGSLNNAFLVIPADRFVHKEDEDENRNKKIELSPSTFKNWLLHIVLDKQNEKIFQDISSKFDNEPFNQGRVTMARINNNEIEIIVEDKDGLKLPINRRGSGIQQLLLLLSYIMQSKSSIIGIEELEINLSPTNQRKLFFMLLALVNSKGGIVKQILITTHSPQIAVRSEASRRLVLINNGETVVSHPEDVDINTFFTYI